MCTEIRQLHHLKRYGEFCISQDASWLLQLGKTLVCSKRLLAYLFGGPCSMETVQSHSNGTGLDELR